MNNSRAVVQHQLLVPSASTITRADQVIEQSECWFVSHGEKKGVKMSEQSVASAARLIAALYHQPSLPVIKDPHSPRYIPIQSIWSLPPNSSSEPFVLQFPQRG